MKVIAKMAVLTAMACAFFSPAWVGAADAPAAPKERKYAPSREIDILHVKLDVTPDFDRRTIGGTTTIRFKPISRPLDELRLNAVDLDITKVTATGASVGAYHLTADELVITFKDAVATGREATVTIAHSAQPKHGVHFRTPAMGYKEGEAHLFTQGETNDARYWFPSFDEPNEKFTSEVICHVPEGMKVFSNGRLVSVKKDPTGGLTAYHWSQEKPHVTYLISLLAGPFQSIEDQYRDIPLAFHTLPSQIAQARNSFANTKDMMAFFEQEIGVPYPWAKYDQICVNDFLFGGMENTSISTLTEGTLFTSATENLRDSDGLVAHELAHQWFGDLLTTKDWSHVWLNEGFASYYTHLYTEHHEGRDDMLYGLYGSANNAISGSDRKPIVYREFDKPMDQFSYRAYPKGGWVLHMLRSQLGPQLYRKVIKTYVERNSFQNVVTENLNSVIEELSGRSFDRFFDQWVYHAHHPELEVKYAWDEKLKLAKITVEQTQKLDDQVMLFEFPVKVRFKTAKGQTVDRDILVSQRSEDFYVSLPAVPTIVRFDPEYSVLAKVSFRLPNAMLYAQLADSSDMMGRLFAINQLLEQKNDQSDFIARLKTALQNDGFYGIRIKAAEALRKIHTAEALAALTDAVQQSDARVRQAVVVALGGFYREESYKALLAQLAREKNPAIVADTLKGLSAYSRPQVREALLKALNTPSYQAEIADGAIAAMKSQDDTSFIAPIREAITDPKSDFTSRGIGSALETLAYLGRDLGNKDELREFLVGYTASKKDSVQRAALGALGTLEDPRAIPVLQTFAGSIEDSAAQKAAQKSLTALRAARGTGDDLKLLREEVLEQGKQNKVLKEEVDRLRKQVEALGK